MVEYPFNIPGRTEREADWQTTRDIISLIEFSTCPELLQQKQCFLILSNSSGNPPNMDPLLDKRGEIIIEIQKSDRIDTLEPKEGAKGPIPLGYYSSSYDDYTLTSSDIHLKFIQLGIVALNRGRSVCGVQTIEDISNRHVPK